MISFQGNKLKKECGAILQIIGLLLLFFNAAGCLGTKGQLEKESSNINPKTASIYQNSKPISGERRGQSERDNKGNDGDHEIQKSPPILKEIRETVWLKERAGEGDLWAKYFLARAHLTTGLKIKLHESFDSLGLPSEVRPYWENFYQVVKQKNVKGDISYAGQLCEEGIKKNFGPLMSLRGLMFRKGLGGLPLDHREAVEWFRKAADHGDTAGMVNLGWSYANGKGVGKNESVALRWYQKAADLGDARGMVALGGSYSMGRGVPQNDVEALHWFQKAAGFGHAGAMYFVGLSYAAGKGVAKDEKEALGWYQKAAALDSAEAMIALGMAYLSGVGVPQDEAEGVRWLKQAAALENLDAMYRLGLVYEQGQGLPKNNTEAVKWFRQAAEFRHPEAMFKLGINYAEGQGVVQDNAQAQKWLLKASELDHTEAMLILGMANLERRLGILGSEQDAIRWFEDAGNLGDVNGMIMAGRVYQHGDIFMNDFGKAMDWYKKAIATTEDPKLRREVEKLMAKGPQTPTPKTFRSREKREGLNPIITALVAMGIVLSFFPASDTGYNPDTEPPWYKDWKKMVQVEADISVLAD